MRRLALVQKRTKFRLRRRHQPEASGAAGCQGARVFSNRRALLATRVNSTRLYGLVITMLVARICQGSIHLMMQVDCGRGLQTLWSSRWGILVAISALGQTAVAGHGVSIAKAP